MFRDLDMGRGADLIEKFVRTTRRYLTVQIRTGQQILTAEDPLPADLRDALATTR
jgi:hypothetical protein